MGKVRLAALVPDIEHFQHRVIQDALNEATANYWRRRGAAFAGAVARGTDYPGRLTPLDHAARNVQLLEVSRACYARSALAIVDSWPARA